MRVRSIAGFTVITHPMPSPIATVRVMVNAGSYHEVVPGTAHFLEHMFFKGTELRGYEELNRILASIGDSNAYTAQDQTCFHINTTGPHVLRAFSLLTEMMFRPSMSTVEMDKERTVILEEYQARQDDPGNFFCDNSIEFLLGSQLGHGGVGTEETIMGMSLEHLLAFRKAHYNRANIAFLLIGNVEHVTENNLARVLAPYSAVPQGALNNIPTLPLNLGTTIKPTGLNFRHVSKQAWLALWVPGFTDRENYNLCDAPNILYDALGGGMHSLLFSRIREELGLAYTTGVMPMTTWGNALNGCFALLQTKNVKECQEEIALVLQQLARNGVPGEILNASISHFEFCQAQEAQTPAGYAMTYTSGYFQNPDLLTGYEERMRRLHAAREQIPDMVEECAKRLVTGLTVTVMNGPKSSFSSPHPGQ